MDFTNYSALITGSATGLGASIAKKLAQSGANIILNYTKSRTEAEETAQFCRDQNVNVKLVQANVAEYTDCQKLADSAREFGKLDILVNNAGITRHAPDHSDMNALTAQDFQQIYAVNVIGPYQMIRACKSLLMQCYEQNQQSASVLNISSIAGVKGIGSSVAYAASKGALNTMTLSLARALAPHIRVNALCPGFIGTRWFSDYLGEEKFARMQENIVDSTPLAMAPRPDEIADTALYFLHGSSKVITGETLLADGGTHLVLGSTIRK